MLVTAALLGLAAAPHCFGMCGPLAASSCGRSRAGTPVYLAARLVGYALVGAAAGAAGRPLALGWAARGLQVGVAVVLAASLLATARRWLRPGAAPLVRLGRGPRTASLLARAVAWLPRSPAGLGAATALFPCGALAGGVLVAAAAGSPARGAAALVVFGLASAPGLLAATLAARAGSRLTPATAGPRVRAAVGGALVALAVWMVAAPWIGVLRSGDPASCACGALP